MTRLALQSPGFRKRQMLTIVAHTILIPLCLSAFFILCAFPVLWPAIFVYGLFIVVDPRAESGAVLSPLQELFRNSVWWRWFAEYYPIVIHKTVDLDPCFEVNQEDTKQQAAKSSTEVKKEKSLSFIVRFYRFNIRLASWWYYTITGQSDKYAKKTGKRYIFGYHPHGIIGMGVVGGMATNGALWNSLFPGIPVRLLTIANNFKLPIYREYLLGAGIASVSKKNCLKMLENGNPICIVIGGARESLLAQPGRMDLILAKRFGFIKVALQTGASIVPVAGFGENDLYQQAKLDGGVGSNMHLFMTRNFGYTIPLFHARGIWNYDKGIIPYRRAINIVVGKPIDLPKVSDPDHKTIKRYHDLYEKQLTQLYNDNRAKYWPEGADLNIVDAN